MAFQIVPYLVVLAASALLSYALRPKPKTEQPEPGDFNFPQSEEGAAIPVIFGRALIQNPSLVWWGEKDIDYEGSDEDAHYEYAVGFHFILCHEADSLRKIYFGDKLAWSGTTASDAEIRIDKGGLFGGDNRDGGLIGDFDIMFGRTGSAVNAWLASKITDIDPHPAFRGVVSVVGQRPNVGNSPQLKTFAFELRRAWTGWYSDKAVIGSDGDVNPAHILYETLTNSVWGMGYSAATIDSDVFTAAADTLYSEGFGLSITWGSDNSVESFIQSVLNHIHGMLYVIPATGKIGLRLIRGGYDIESLAVFDESNILELASFARRGWGESVSEVQITWTDPTKRYRATTVTVHDYGVHTMQGGGAVPQKTTYAGITTAGLASRVASRDLRIQAAPVATLKMRVNRQAWNLSVGEVFRFQWASLAGGAVDIACRVIDLDLGTPTDPVIEVTATEDIFSLPDSGWIAGQGSESSDVTPAAVPAQLISEAPYWYANKTLGKSQSDIEALPATSGWLVYAGARPSGHSHYALWTDAGGGYVERKTSVSFSPYAELAETVSRTETSIDLENTVDLSRVAAGGLAQIRNELVVVDAVDIDNATITVRRGALDTIPASYDSGEPVFFIENRLYSDGIVYAAGAALKAKAVTTSGLGDLDIASAPAATRTATGRARRPYNVKKLRFNSQYYPDSIGDTDELYISWSNTNRLSQITTPVTFTDSGVTLESGCEVNIKLWGKVDAGALETELREVTTTGQEYNYLAADEMADTPGGVLNAILRVQVWVDRGGLESWQRYEWTITRNGLLYP